jgi:phage terminase small subunit
MKLTAKQQAFCEEYLLDLNATQAAVRAGYSAKTARQVGSQNLSKLVIAEYIAESMKKRSKKTEIDAAWVLAKSVILHNRCMVEGDEFSPSGAGKALDLIGKHIDVQAYSEKSVVVEMSHEEWLDSIK